MTSCCFNQWKNVYGWLRPDLINFSSINEISRPTDIPDSGLICDLLWSDPEKDVLEFDENDRGVSVFWRTNCSGI